MVIVNKKGFTLIEVLAVIALLAVLMLLITPNLTKVFSKSKVDTMKIQESEVKDSSILYLEDFCKNPLPGKICPSTITKDETRKYNGYVLIDELVNEEYIDEIISDGEVCTGCVIYTSNKPKVYLSCKNYETETDINYKNICNIN